MPTACMKLHDSVLIAKTLEYRLFQVQILKINTKIPNFRESIKIQNPSHKKKRPKSHKLAQDFLPGATVIWITDKPVAILGYDTRIIFFSA